MVSMRFFRYLLLIFFVLQLHAEVSSANFNSQAPQTENSEVLGASTITQIANMHAEDVIENRKTVKHVNVNVKANEKNALDIESKETVRKRKSKKRPTKTASLTADYSNPSHHSPRHN